jgi:hypothetical protein
MNAPDKKYVIIKAKGGLGNRLLCAITGLLFAEATNRTPIVDWTDGIYNLPKVNAFPLLFNYKKATGQTTQIPSLTNTPYPRVWNNQLDKSIAEMMSNFPPKSHKSRFIHRKFSIDVRRKYDEQKTVIFWNYIDRINKLKPLFKRAKHPYATLNRSRIIGDFLTNQLTVKPETQSIINRFHNQNFTGPTIGVHLRYTDRKISLQKYQTAIDRHLKRDPELQIFLASDSREATEWLKSKYDRVITIEKWMPSDDRPMHNSENSIDKNKMAHEALLDIHLLSKCDYLIYPSNSTFSYISHCLNISSKKNHTDVVKFSPTILLNKFLREFIA